MTRRPRVLVVDDDRELRETLVDVLAECGLDPIPARHGAEALAHLRACGPTPSLILLDMMMPVMDGVEFRRRQLSDPAMSAIPVVVVTAHRAAAGVIDEIAPDGVLEKPIDLADLLSQVRKLCPSTRRE